MQLDPTVSAAIGRVLGGDHNAFRIIMRDQSVMLRSYLAGQLFHLDEVDDLAQEVFLTALDRLETYDAERDFGAWLRGIARHKLYNHFRSMRRRGAAMQRFQEEVFEILDPELEKAAAAENALSIQTLLQCVEKLPDRLRKVVRSGLDGQRADQLASDLRTTRGAVYNLHYRANRLLRECVSTTLTELT